MEGEVNLIIWSTKIVDKSDVSVIVSLLLSLRQDGRWGVGQWVDTKGVKGEQQVRVLTYWLA